MWPSSKLERTRENGGTARRCGPTLSSITAMEMKTWLHEPMVQGSDGWQTTICKRRRKAHKRWCIPHLLLSFQSFIFISLIWQDNLTFFWKQCTDAYSHKHAHIGTPMTTHMHILYLWAPPYIARILVCTPSIVCLYQWISTFGTLPEPVLPISSFAHAS